MAVRDDEQAGTDDQDSRRLPWRETLGHVPAFLVVGGLLIYAYLSFCYARFYGSLGIDPNDVGLSYTGTLARSSGFVVAYVIASVGFLPALWSTIRPTAARRDEWHRRPIRIAAFTALAAVSVGVAFSVSGADIAADEVRAGKAVSPIGFWLAPIRGLEILAIHADPATVEPAGKPSDSPAAERLRGRKLLYLGQSGGTVVLYDAATQRAVYVPASSIILHVANCDAKPSPDAACEPTWGLGSFNWGPGVGLLIPPLIALLLLRLRRR